MKIDFRGHLWSQRPRLLWQALFNIYKEKGCDLTNLDNLLIDYDTLKKGFSDFDQQVPSFVWTCEPNHFVTGYCPMEDMNEYLAINNPSVAYLVLIDDDEATLEELDGPQGS